MEGVKVVTLLTSQCHDPLMAPEVTYLSPMRRGWSTDGSVDLQMEAKASKKKRYTGEIHLQSKCAQFTEFLTDPCSLPHVCTPESHEKAILRSHPYKPKPIRKRVGPRKSVGGPQKEEEPPQVEKKEEPQKEEEPPQVEPKELGDLDLD
ncbi:unnamed protein product [Nippostrongylus brasiliensis]|uniref:Fibroblast growth factor-binding protein 3 n=1 Tax=Nippostrongylus brasiliensis TaxID=27835 RepID=A0A0N4YL88_NIPBR|nr:unnamed protein product [Nippostrongylus brasiliensis]